MLRITKYVGRGKTDAAVVNCFRDESGNIVVKHTTARNRCKEYMEYLMNVENVWSAMIEDVIVVSTR